MKISFRLLIHTVAHLRPRQIFFQIRNRFVRIRYKKYEVAFLDRNIKLVKPIEKPCCWDGEQFTFLNISSPFQGWNDTKHGMLWAYNLNYMDWLGQANMTADNGLKWIDTFIQDFDKNKVGQDPYPIALRSINWIKFFSLYPQVRSALRDSHLYSQCQLLARKLEYHLMGNHLLEDVYALFIAAIYFEDKPLYFLSQKILHQELEEQILPDGAHYEQSPMYHCILLDRLLDVYNIAKNNEVFDEQKNFTLYIQTKAEAMLGHLSSISYSDGQIPLLNDSALGIAPTVPALFSYAERLGLNWNMRSMREVGYRKLKGGDWEAIVDIGNITADYQCGHSHADTFNYELRHDNKAIVIDTGISTYDTTERRQYERGTSAHNTVLIDEKNSSEVWSSFRIGKRAKAKLLLEGDTIVAASHNGFGRNLTHVRGFQVANGEFIVEDFIAGNAEGCSFIHFAPSIDVKLVGKSLIEANQIKVLLHGANDVSLSKEQISTRYNQFETSSTVKIKFRGKMKYIFLINSAQNQRCIKRVNEFVEQGYDVEAYAFSRGTEMRNNPNFELNIIGTFANDSSYTSRLKVMYDAIRKVLSSMQGGGKICYYVFSLDVAMMFRLQSRVPYIYEESDLMHTYLGNSILRRTLEGIDKKIIKNSQLTVFTSEGFAKYHFGDSYPQNICFIPNRLHPSILNLPEINKATLNLSHLRIGFVGGARFKSVARFAEYVLKNFPQHEFHFFGHVVVNFQKEFDALKVYPNVHFHGAFKNPDDLPAIYSQLDMVLSTYDVEFDNVRYAEPNKLYEAVYFETPIIVSTGTFLADKVKQLGIGYEVDPLDEKNVADLISSFSEKDIKAKQDAARHIGKEWALNRNDEFFERLKICKSAIF